MANILSLASAVNPETISWAYSFLGHVYRGTQVLESVIDLHCSVRDTEMSSWQKTHRIATDAFALICQLANVGVAIKGTSNEVFADVKVTIKVASCGANVAKVISQKSVQQEKLDLADCADIALTTATGLLGVAESMECNVKCVESAAQVVAVSRQVMIKKESIVSAIRSIQRRVASMRQTPQLVAPLANRAADVGERENRVNLDDLGVDERYLQGLIAIRQARRIEDLDFIPEPFADDPVLRLYCCPITQKPIRYIVMVDHVTTRGRATVFYERSAIMDFIDNRPGELPPRWPETLECTAEYLTPFEFAQSQIDDQLQILFNGPVFRSCANQVLNDLNL